MNKKERLILEEMSSLLNTNPKLGLSYHDQEESSHHPQFRWEDIKEEYALKVNQKCSSAFFESITSAFRDIHSYKYINHPTFRIALEKSLTARAVPSEDLKTALECLDEIVSKLNKTNINEQDAGWNPNIEEIANDTREADKKELKREKPFTGGGPWPDK